MKKDESYIIGHYYNKESMTDWEVWSNGEAYATNMEISLVRSAGGLWHPISTYDRFTYGKHVGMQKLQLLTAAGAFDFDQLGIKDGVDKVFKDWLCKIIIET